MNDSCMGISLPEDKLRPRIEAVSARIAELQLARSGRYIVFNHDPTGLGGQISRRLLAIRVALMTGRTAVFPNEDFYPYENAFEPLALPPTETRKIVPVLNAQLEEDPNPIVSFDFWRFWKNELMRHKIYGYIPNELAGLANHGLILDGIIFSSFRLNLKYRCAITPFIERIKATAPVIGVHFRRGDKYVETPYVSAEIYRENVEAVAARHNIQNILISSDSAEAVDKLHLDRNRFNIFFDDQEKRYNNANHKFLMKHRELACQETMTAIRNIYMLGHCTKVVGQTNAHFARLAAGQIMINAYGADFGVLLEPNLMPRKWTDRLTYGVYRGVRTIAKKIFFMYP